MWLIWKGFLEATSGGGGQPFIASMVAVIILSADAELLSYLMILPMRCHDQLKKQKGVPYNSFTFLHLSLDVALGEAEG